jgi:hypothetical protein
MCAVGAFIEQLYIPRSREDHVVRKYALIMLALSSGVLFIAMSAAERVTGSGVEAKYGDKGKRNIILNISFVSAATIMFISVIVLLAKLKEFRMPDVSEELKQCREIGKAHAAAVADCLDRYSGEDTLRICDHVFENNKIAVDASFYRAGRPSPQIHTYKFNTESKYCLGSKEYNFQMAIATLSLLTLFLYSVLQTIIFKLMSEGHGQFGYQNVNY